MCAPDICGDVIESCLYIQHIVGIFQHNQGAVLGDGHMLVPANRRLPNLPNNRIVHLRGQGTLNSSIPDASPCRSLKTVFMFSTYLAYSFVCLTQPGSCSGRWTHAGPRQQATARTSEQPDSPSP